MQQIALATGDIYRTVEEMRTNGVELLPIPENYYDDLEAQTDLDAAQIASRPPFCCRAPSGCFL